MGDRGARALEEAGIEGEVDPRPIGNYRTFKTLAIRRKIIDVEMYPLRLTHHSTIRRKRASPSPLGDPAGTKRLLSDARLAELAVN